MNTAIIGIGSNLDAENNVRIVREIIARELKLSRESTFVTTEAVDMPGAPDFLNGAFKVETIHDLLELTTYLKDVEGALGRDPDHKENESRSIDLDIIVFNGVIVNDDFERYAFVRNAVLELAPELRPQKSKV